MVNWFLLFISDLQPFRWVKRCGMNIENNWRYLVEKSGGM
jgi:hypothetical protein